MLDSIGSFPPAVRRHLRNVADNLQLMADFGYGDVALAVADARPVTAVAALAASRVGETLPPDREIEAYRVLETGGPVCGTRRRTTRGISYTTEAYPVGPESGVYAVLVRDVARQVLEAPGRMETQFMQIAEANERVSSVAVWSTICSRRRPRSRSTSPRRRAQL